MQDSSAPGAAGKAASHGAEHGAASPGRGVLLTPAFVLAPPLEPVTRGGLQNLPARAVRRHRFEAARSA
jgi:hypothetical protein